MYRTDLPAAVSTTSTPARPRRRGAVVRTRVAGALVAVAVGAGGFGLTACDSAPSTAGYENLSYAGQNPFTPPVGADDPDVLPLAGAGGVRPGDAEALYARDPDAPPCDAAALVTNLRGDTAKATAWAEVLGIDVARIPDLVESLTPVVLRSDTAVTNHTYVDGTYRAAPAVLATGTAVFVSVYGEPTVKCVSGNPLTRPTSADPAVTTVTPSRAVITHPSYADPETGTPSVQPHELTQEQLVAAAESARELATRAAQDATDARRLADEAKTALDRATQEVEAAGTAVSDAEAKVAWLEQQLEQAKQDGSSPSVIARFEQLLNAGRADLTTARGTLDGLTRVAAERQARFDEHDRAATEKEEIAMRSDEVAHTAEQVAGLSSPDPWTPTRDGESTEVVDDATTDAPQAQERNVSLPAEEGATPDADTPEDDDARAGGATTRPVPGDGDGDGDTQ